MYKIFHNKNPEYLCGGFTRVCDTHGHATRSSSFNFTVPCIKSSQESTFYYRGIGDWNALPDSIKSIRTLTGFKKAVKIYLQTEQENTFNSDFKFY